MAWTKAMHEQHDALVKLLDRVDPYMQRLSIAEPWYESISAGNVASDSRIMTIDAFPLFRVFDFLIAYYGEDIVISDRSSRRSGYIPEGNTVILIPYRGKFGAGWIVATHYSNTTVNCKYCLLADGGLNHGRKEKEKKAD